MNLSYYYRLLITLMIFLYARVIILFYPKSVSFDTFVCPSGTATVSVL